jgi:hypothetical protein
MGSGQGCTRGGCPSCDCDICDICDALRLLTPLGLLGTLAVYKALQTEDHGFSTLNAAGSTRYVLGSLRKVIQWF